MRFVSLIALVCATLLLSACAVSTIAEIKDDSMVGKTVRVQGTVQDSIKIGDFSGYTIKDDSGESIGVSSKALPAQGDVIAVKGVLMHDTIFGYYIKTDK